MAWHVRIVRSYSLLDIYDYGIKQCRHDVSFDGESGFKLCYVVKGKGCLKLDGEKYDIHKNNSFFLQEDTHYHCRAAPGMSLDILWISFGGEYGRIIDEMYKKSGSGLVLFHSDMQVFESQFEVMKAYTLQKPKVDELFFISVLSSLAYHTLKGSYVDCIASANIEYFDTVKNTEKSYIKNAIEFIHKRYGSSIQVKDISDHLNIDRSYFSRIFKKTLCMSPSSYILQYKLERACNLLITTTLSVEKIAGTCGFPHSNQFYDSFRKKYGCSPTVYRQDNSVKNEARNERWQQNEAQVRITG